MKREQVEAAHRIAGALFQQYSELSSQRGMTQQQAASRLGISRAQWFALKKGGTGMSLPLYLALQQATEQLRGGQ